jgi:hypothetical protein
MKLKTPIAKLKPGESILSGREEPNAFNWGIFVLILVIGFSVFILYKNHKENEEH